MMTVKEESPKGGHKMIYVVLRTNNKILNRCDAWEQNGELRMRRWAREEGWVPTEIEITLMGDMIIWVE